MPRRVLDVGNEGSTTIRLVEARANAQHGHYATLSHCWGQGKVTKLTLATIDTFLLGVKVSELPMLYQDVITACRQLEIQYLWIDSLCIIQDHEVDWTHEISLMGEMYSNAVCNIEAAYALDDSSRLFMPRNQTRIKPFPVTLEWHEDGPLPFFLIDLSVQHQMEMSEAPLLKRAWVLQEQLLAKRSIIYGKSQVHWICHTLEASEMFPKAVPDLREGSAKLHHSLAPLPIQCLKSMVASKDPIYFHHPLYNSSPNVSPMERFWLSWRSIVLDYTRRSLTFEKDRLAAIAGVASMIQSKTNMQYVAGMWNSRFFIEYELCWQVSKRADLPQPFRPSAYRAPSWSWASVEGAISYRYKEDHDLTGDTQHAFVENVESLDGTSTGPLESAIMRIEGPLSEGSRYWCRPDDSAQELPDTIFYLTMFSLYFDSMWGLALRRIDFGPYEGCYARIGTFRYSDDDGGRPKGSKMLITII